MPTTAKIEIRNNNPVEALRGFLGGLLDAGSVDGVLVPAHVFGTGMPMPTLITDKDDLAMAAPLTPAFAMNGARLVSRLTRGQAGGRIAAVLRPCEIRAFVELVKLNQGSTDGVVIVGLDCPGALSNTDYRTYLGDGEPEQATLAYHGLAQWDRPVNRDGAQQDGIGLAEACKACEHPAPENADIVIGLAGADLKNHLPVTAATARGESLLNAMDLPATEESDTRKQALEAMVEKRAAYRDEMFARTAEATKDLDGLATFLSSCVNCYNCRVACPVCYCKECVFNTDVFEHQPWQYLGWARQRGSLKMPTDTVFFHLTRMAHLSTACGGCGQGSNACPNDVPVMELFRTVAAKTQQGFDYEPGRSLEEPPPLSVFKEDEFQDTVSHLV